MILSGIQVSPAINYRTLRPHNEELADTIRKSRDMQVNNYALPSLIMAVILLILSLPVALKEEIDLTNRLLLTARYALHLLNCTIWYMLRKRFKPHHITIFVIYSYSAFMSYSLVFAEVVSSHPHANWFTYVAFSESYCAYIMVSLIYI